MRAQTDVTSTYITNPSFESDGAITASNGALTITGWTQSDPGDSYNNTGCYDKDTAVPTQGTVTVTPSSGDYLLFFRKGWSQATYTFTSAATSLPAGVYTLSVDYKMLEGYDNKENNNSKVIISAKNGETTLGSWEGTEKTNVKGENEYTYLNTAGWSKAISRFMLTETTSVNVVISLQAGGQRRTDFVVDNVRLYYAPFDAAPTNYSEVVAGDFYIVNAATGKYLGGANSWGTQASIIEHGIPFTAAVSDGKYTLDSHTYNNTTSHFFSGTYVDGGSTNLYITSLGSGKYSISTAEGSAYVTATSATTVDNTAANADSPLAQWYFVNKGNRDALFASATNASPVDATYYLTEANISRNLRKAYNTSGWTGEKAYGGANDNQCAERYKATTNVYQTVSVPNGKYTVACQGFYRQESGSAISYLYANDEQVALDQIYSGGINSMTGASNAFSVGEYRKSLPVYVTDGSLTVGVKCDAATNWTIWDNFELSYHGPIISGEATEIAMNTETAMTAGSWYYFDIPVDGMYDLTTTALSDIVYTTDGTILIENGSSVTANFAQAVNVSLTAGRYYVKSASAQNLKVTVGAYAYNVGTATLSAADDSYTQNSTFTVTFPSAATSDPGATATLVASSKATVNGAEVALLAVTNGFSLNLGTLTENTDYTISIPAGVYGYAGESMNEAISLTLHTPTVFDGIYCLYDATNKLFLGRGCGYGTEAVADKYGIPFNYVTDATGVASIEFVDWTGVYLFITGTSVYTDNASTGWKLVPTSGGYYLRNSDLTVYTSHSMGTYGEYVHTTPEEASATIWTLKTKAERDAIVNAYPTDNINNVITASGVSTTAGDFATYLSSNFNSEDKTSEIGTATFASAVGDWTWSQVRGQDNQPAYGANFAELWNATGNYSQTIGKANLPEGIYKVTVQGYERRKDNDAASALNAAGYNLVSTFLSANGEQVRFTDWNDVAGKPTNTGGAVTAFNDGEAVNEVYVYLDGNTDLTLTVKKPNYIWDCWVIFNNFTLTRYYQTSANMTIAAGKYGTFVAPFDVTIPDGVTAEKVTGVSSSTLVTEAVETTIPANTPVLVSSEAAVNTTFYGKGDAVGTVKPDGQLLTGVYEAVEIPAGSYVLQTQDGVQAFYKLDANATANTVNRAYLTVPASPVKAFFFNSDDADAIKSIEATDDENTVIYNYYCPLNMTIRSEPAL